MEKDITILNLLIGWEIIHFSKTGRNLSFRLREFPDKHSRFFRISFNKCTLAEILNFSQGQTEDLSSFNFKGCVFAQVKIENGAFPVISLQYLKFKGCQIVGFC
jgi:hypothetical protein